MIIIKSYNYLSANITMMSIIQFLLFNQHKKW